MFNNKRRIASAWAKGLMLGKAVGAKDERERIKDQLTRLSDLLKKDGLSPSSAFAIDRAIVMIEQSKND